MLSMGSLELLLKVSVFTVLDLNEMGGTTLPTWLGQLEGRFSGRVCLGW